MLTNLGHGSFYYWAGGSVRDHERRYRANHHRPSAGSLTVVTFFTKAGFNDIPFFLRRYSARASAY